jgi:hypothetical protein
MEIMSIPLDGGPAVEIGVEGTPLRVDPSGTPLIFERREGGDPAFAYELWMLRLGGGR